MKIVFPTYTWDRSSHLLKWFCAFLITKIVYRACRYIGRFPHGLCITMSACIWIEAYPSGVNLSGLGNSPSCYHGQLNISWSFSFQLYVSCHNKKVHLILPYDNLLLPEPQFHTYYISSYKSCDLSRCSCQCSGCWQYSIIFIICCRSGSACWDIPG